MTEQDPKRDPNYLEGWQSIADYLGWSVSTTRRRKKDFPDFPIRQMKGARPHAFKDQLGDYLRKAGETTSPPEEPDQSKAGAEPDRPAASAIKLRSRRLILPLSAAAIALALVGLVGLAFLKHTQLVLTTESRSVQQGRMINLLVVGIPPGNSVWRWSKLPNGVDSMSPKNRPMLSDARGEVAFQFSPACGTPVGDHKLWVEDANTRRQSNRVAVRVLAVPGCDKPVPDLVAGPLSVTAASVFAGETLRASFEIRNQGRASGPELLSRFRLSTSQRTTNRDISPLTFHF